MSTQKEKTPPPASDPKKAGDAKPAAAADGKQAPAADPKKAGDAKAAGATDPKAAPAGPGSPKNGPTPGAPGVPKVVFVTIDSFDFRKPQDINSPRSMEAMRFLGVAQSDLKCKTEEELKPLFNLQDKKEKEAYEACVAKHKKAYDHLKKKVSDKRAEIIKEHEAVDKKRKEQEEYKQKQLKMLDEEKKSLMKHLEAEQKKKDEAEKKKKLEEAKKAGGDKDKKPEAGKKADPGSPKSPGPADKKDPKSPGPAAGDKKEPKRTVPVPGASPDKKDPGSPKTDTKDTKGPLKPVASSALLTGVDTQSLPSLKKKKTKADKEKEDKKVLKLDDELRDSSILQFLDKSAAHKDRLDLSLHERTKKDLERDKLRMKELMKKTKKEILTMSEKRGLSAYKSHENLGNAKTRKIEYLYDLSRNPVELMKDRQQKEMEAMMNYEIGLQAMRKQRQDFMENKHKFYRGEQQYKEIVFEYNKKILVREKQLKEMQKKIAEENKLYHVQRIKKANDFERAKMVSKLESVDMRAKSMKEDREEYLETRKFMVQKLRKDLEEMKHGMMDAQALEKKYAFLHDDQEFKRMMEELKKERKELGSRFFDQDVRSVVSARGNRKNSKSPDRVGTATGQKLQARDASAASLKSQTAADKPGSAVTDKKADKDAKDGKSPDKKDAPVDEKQRKQAIADLKLKQVGLF